MNFWLWHGETRINAFFWVEMHPCFFWKWRRKMQALVIKVGMLSSGLKYTLQGHSIVLWKTFPVEQQTKLFLPSWLLWYEIWSMSSGVFASFESFHLSWWSWQQCICGGISRENKLSFSGTLGRVNFSCCHCGRSDKTNVSVFSHLSDNCTSLVFLYHTWVLGKPWKTQTKESKVVLTDTRTSLLCV